MERHISPPVETSSAATTISHNRYIQHFPYPQPHLATETLTVHMLVHHTIHSAAPFGKPAVPEAQHGTAP